MPAQFFFARLTRTQRVLIIAGAAVLGLLVLAWKMLPMIASGMAARGIERAFAQRFNGSAKVGRVSLGWNSPMTLDSIEIRDDRGQKVGTLSATIPASLWDLIH